MFKWLKYKFDRTLSHGPLALAYWLLIVSSITVLITTIIVWYLSISPEKSFIENLWTIFNRSLDPGNVADDEGPILYVTITVAVTLFGLVVVSTLIGIINASLEDRLASLRRGRSKVIEKGHTVIFGWSSRIIPIIREFIEVNKSKYGKSKIVIFGNIDKVSMQEKIDSDIEEHSKTEIICRTGTSADLKASEITNVNQAKSIIIIGPEGENSDVDVIKRLLAITKNPNRSKNPYRIITEIKNPKNAELAKTVGGTEAFVVTVSDLLSRLIVQTSKQPGLPIVYDELMSYFGNEFYFTNEKQHNHLYNKIFKEICLSFSNTIIVGIAKNNHSQIILNPSPNELFKKGDRLITIAESKSKIFSKLSKPTIDNDMIEISKKEIKTKPEKTIIIGWNWKTIPIISKLDKYAPNNSSITILTRIKIEDEEKDKIKIKNFKNINFIQGDSAEEAIIKSLKIETFNKIIILSSLLDVNIEQADAHTLVTLLYIRNILSKYKVKIPIVTEMLDVQNRDLAKAASSDDFVVSDQMVSKVITKYAEQPNVYKIFDKLLTPGESKIEIKEIGNYIKLGQSVNFYTLIESAFQKGECAIGYRLHSKINDKSENYGVYINPDKKIKIGPFSDQDKLIVLS